MKYFFGPAFLLVFMPFHLSGSFLQTNTNRQAQNIASEPDPDFEKLSIMIRDLLSADSYNSSLSGDNNRGFLTPVCDEDATYLLEIRAFKNEKCLYTESKGFASNTCSLAKSNCETLINQYSNFCACMSTGSVSGSTSFPKSDVNMVQVEVNWNVHLENEKNQFRKIFDVFRDRGGSVELSDGKRITWLFLKKESSDFFAVKSTNAVKEDIDIF